MVTIPLFLGPGITNLMLLFYTNIAKLFLTLLSSSMPNHSLIDVVSSFLLFLWRPILLHLWQIPGASLNSVYLVVIDPYWNTINVVMARTDTTFPLSVIHVQEVLLFSFSILFLPLLRLSFSRLSFPYSLSCRDHNGAALSVLLLTKTSFSLDMLPLEYLFTLFNFFFFSRLFCHFRFTLVFASLFPLFFMTIKERNWMDSGVRHP